MDYGQLDAPPKSPELPEQAGRYPAWPWWYAPVAFIAGFLLTGVAVAILAAAGGVDGDSPPPWYLIVGTLIQNALLIGAAVFFARLTAPVRSWHFGLRPTAPWWALLWAVVGMAVYYVVAGVYDALVDIDAQQEVVEDLGARDSSSGLVIAGLMIVVSAPILEELFWRGFVYRSLRNAMRLIPAALTAGFFFGLIHFSIDDPSWDALLLILPLGLLGMIFCLLYEKTGSLFPCIGLHAFNNAVAYALTVDGGWQVALPAGAAMIAGCFLVPRLFAPTPAPEA